MDNLKFSVVKLSDSELLKITGGSIIEDMEGLTPANDFIIEDVEIGF